MAVGPLTSSRAISRTPLRQMGEGSAEGVSVGLEAPSGRTCSEMPTFTLVGIPSVVLEARAGRQLQLASADDELADLAAIFVDDDCGTNLKVSDNFWMIAQFIHSRDDDAPVGVAKTVWAVNCFFMTEPANWLLARRQRRY